MHPVGLLISVTSLLGKQWGRLEEVASNGCPGRGLFLQVLLNLPETVVNLMLGSVAPLCHPLLSLPWTRGLVARSGGRDITGPTAGGVRMSLLGRSDGE